MRTKRQRFQSQSLSFYKCFCLVWIFVYIFKFEKQFSLRSVKLWRARDPIRTGEQELRLWEERCLIRRKQGGKNQFVFTFKPFCNRRDFKKMFKALFKRTYSKMLLQLFLLHFHRGPENGSNYCGPVWSCVLHCIIITLAISLGPIIYYSFYM